MGGIWGGRGTDPHTVLPTGPYLQLSVLGLSTLGVWLEFQLGSLIIMSTRPFPNGIYAAEKRDGETVHSLLIT